MKRFLSVLLTVMMLLSMVTISQAEGAPTIEYWNADSTKIILDFSEEVDPDALKEAITLTKGGEEVDFTVAKREKTVNSTAAEGTKNGNQVIKGMIVTDEVTYEIKPEGGLNFTDIYNLTVDESIMGDEPWEKSFKVKKLWKEEFNYTSTTTGEGDAAVTTYNVPWTNSGGKDFKLVEDESGNKALAWTAKGGYFKLMPSYGTNSNFFNATDHQDVNFADTGIPASTYWASGSDARNQTEYNLELEYRIFNKSSLDQYNSHGLTVSMIYPGHQYEEYGTAAIVAGTSLYKGSSSTGLYMSANTLGFDGVYGSSTTISSNGEVLTGNYAWTYWAGAPYVGADIENTTVSWDTSLIKRSGAAPDGDWTNDTYNKLSMLVKDNNLKFYANDGFENYDFTPYKRADNKNYNKLGLVMFSGSSTYAESYHTTYYLDNIIATKAVEIKKYSLTAPVVTSFSIEKITFTLDKNIPAENLAEGITLTADGDAVSGISVEQTGADDGVYTYTVTPYRELDSTAEHVLILAAGEYLDADAGIATLETEFNSGVLTLGEITVTYWNADSSKIMLDFSAPVDATDLKNKLTLYKNGAEVDCTVTYKPQSAASNGTLKDADCTYVVVPQGGMTLDDIYKLVVDTGVVATDKTAVLTTAIEKSFKVKKIWKDDFEGYDAESFSAWGTNHNSNFMASTASTDITVTTLGTNKALSIGGASSIMAIPNKSSGASFADTGVAASTYWNSSTGAGALMEDYSIEMKVRMDANNGIRLGLATTYHYNWHYSDYFMSGAHLTNSGTTMTAQTSVRKRDESGKVQNARDKAEASVATMTEQYKSITALAATGTSFVAGQFVDVSMSVKSNTDGSNMKFFAGSGAYTNYDTTIAISDYGYPLIMKTAENTVYVDDIIVTKAIEYTPSEFTMVPEDGAENVAIGDSITLTFEKDVDTATVSKDTVKLYADEELVSGYTVSVDAANAKVVSIKLDAPFEYRTEYTVEAVDVKYQDDAAYYMFDALSFTTTPPDVEFTQFKVNGDISALEAQEYTVTAKVVNNFVNDGVEGIASLCLYDEDGKMIDVVTKNIDLAKGKGDTITDTWNITEAGRYFAYCYVWDCFDNMNTIIKAILE